MRNLIFGMTLLASVSAVQAQEVNWDGWFAGFDAGYINRTRNSTADGFTEVSGASAGVLAGHWWQVSPVTLGFDVGLSLGGPRQVQSSGPDTSGYSYRFTDSESVTLSVRGKVGAPLNGGLVYLAAGLQYVHTFSRYQASYPDFPDADEAGWTMRSGATMSAGVEYPVLQNITLKAEAGLNSHWPDRITTHGGYFLRTGLNYYFD